MNKTVVKIARGDIQSDIEVYNKFDVWLKDLLIVRGMNIVTVCVKNVENGDTNVCEIVRSGDVSIFALRIRHM
jgi:hypothetical protein